MKNIKLFEDYINEAEETDKTETDEVVDIKVPERSSAVVSKKFFNELEHNLYYWFKHGNIKKQYSLVDIEKDPRAVTVWMQDKVDNETETPQYMYRIKYYESDPKGLINKIEDVILTIDVYNHDKSSKLKELTIQINTKHINEKFLIERIKRLMKKIVSDPKDQKQHDDFMDRQYTRLTDEYY